LCALKIHASPLIVPPPPPRSIKPNLFVSAPSFALFSFPETKLPLFATFLLYNLIIYSLYLKSDKLRKIQHGGK